MVDTELRSALRLAIRSVHGGWDIPPAAKAALVADATKFIQWYAAQPLESLTTRDKRLFLAVSAMLLTIGDQVLAGAETQDRRCGTNDC